MPHPGAPSVRGHLRLAAPPLARRRRESRAFLLVRAGFAALGLLAATALAWMVTAVALAPLLWRRAPRGLRVTPIRRREARIIKFQPRRALPR